MDSGNCESSSGGDEEYDSRAADPFPPFMTHPPPPLQPPPAIPLDPLSNFFPNSSLYNNAFWPRNTTLLRSDPYNHHPTDNNDSNNINLINPFIPSFQEPPATVAPPTSAATPRNTKKRSRASRRAPTTVLTTDTTNFRAMVQEFTGIPASPFTTPSPFQRNRLDLFGAPAPSGIGSKPPHDASQPLYLRRPFSLKVQSPPPTASTSNAANPPLNYQSSNLFNISNTNTLASSFLQTNHHKFPFSTSLIGHKNVTSFENIHSNIGEFSSSLCSLPQIVSDHNVINNNNNDNCDLINWSLTRTGKMARPPPENVEKGQENVGPRSEGMVESWICSSE